MHFLPRLVLVALIVHVEGCGLELPCALFLPMYPMKYLGQPCMQVRRSDNPGLELNLLD
jgi:hypothetical protein